MKYKAVFFDWDDTLIDSIEARVVALERLFALNSITNITAKRFWSDLQGRPLEEGLTELAEANRIKTGLFEEFRSIYWAKEEGLLRLYPGVREMLERLRGQSTRMALVTNKEMEFEAEGKGGGVKAELAELGVKDWFATTVGPEDVTLLKPNPEPILLALSRLKLAPTEALMVGDSASDIKAAQAAGCTACYATWGLPEEERAGLLGKVTPDFILDTPEDVLRLVK